MLDVRRAGERLTNNRSWLTSKLTFSFAPHEDHRFMGFRALRILNEDLVVPSAGFGAHQHQDMEIVSYVLEGAVAHKDSLGSGSVIKPGEIQRMTAGTGITHSEVNPSASDQTHFMQIWLLPEDQGLQPCYEQKQMPEVTGEAQLDLIGSRDGRNGSVVIHQDVNLYRAILRSASDLEVPLAQGRHAWVQVVRGAATANGVDLVAGDGLAVSWESELSLSGSPDAEMLVFDLA